MPWPKRAPVDFSAADLPLIDWRLPWYAPLQSLGEPMACKARLCGVADALNFSSTTDKCRTLRPPHFVDSESISIAEPYEFFIARTAQIPTRNNLHDFFNGLIWWHHTALKQQINRLHVSELKRLAHTPVTRGLVRDKLTVFDENGLLMQAPASLVDALQRRDWHSLFLEQRPRWASVKLEIVGHALLEKLLQPRKAITAHVIAVPENAPSMSDWLAEHLQHVFDSHQSPRFLPLPLLGIPGWWAPNQQADFYADATVFRGDKKTAAQGGRCIHRRQVPEIGTGTVITSGVSKDPHQP